MFGKHILFKRYLQNPRQIEACVDAAMESCTKYSIRSVYHTAVVKLAGFCEQVKGKIILKYLSPTLQCRSNGFFNKKCIHVNEYVT